MRRERSHVVEREYLQHRLADAAIDLYAMLATLARTSSRIRESGVEEAASEIRMTRIFCDGAWRRVRRNLRAVESNMDSEFDRLVAELRAHGGYAHDII